MLILELNVLPFILCQKFYFIPFIVVILQYKSGQWDQHLNCNQLDVWLKSDVQFYLITPQDKCVQRKALQMNSKVITKDCSDS